MKNHLFSKINLFILILPILIIGTGTGHTWQRTNPGGGAFSTVNAGPSGIIIAGSDLSGAYRSMDRGKTWDAIGASRGVTNTHISGVGFDPSNENIIYLGTPGGIFRSSDKGDSFTRVLDHGYINDIETAKSDSSAAYATYATAWNSLQAYIYKSTDGGVTWSQRSTLFEGYRLLNIMISAQDHNILYVLTGKGRGGCGPAEVYRSMDGGANFQRIGLSLGNIMDFKIDPTDHNKIYATTFNGGCAEKWYYTDREGEFYRSLDGGDTWQQMSQRTGIIWIKSDNPSIIRRIEPRNAADWNPESGTWQTTDYGASWVKTGNFNTWEHGHRIGKGGMGIGFDGFCKCLGEDMSDPDAIYNVTTQWIWGSFDGGVIFKNLFTDEISPDFWQSRGFDNVNMVDMKISEVNSDIMFLGYFDIGLWRSLDHGLSWQQCNNENFTGSWGNNGGNVASICLDPSRANVVWATMSLHQQGASPTYLVRSDNTGERSSWVASHSGLPLEEIMGISVDRNSPDNNRILFTTALGDLYKSTDDGYTWTKVLENNGIRFTAVHNTDSSCVYAGGGSGLWRSLDGGISWSKIGLPEMEGTMEFWGNSNMRGIFDITPGIHDADWLYVTTFGTDKGAYRSKDRGTTWEKLYTDSYMRKISVSPLDKNILYITSSKAMTWGGYSGVSKGLLFSHDRGTTFTQVNEDMAWPFAMTVEIDDAGWVFVGSPGTGFQKSRVPSTADLSTFSKAYGSVLEDTNYMSECDIDKNGDVDGIDLFYYSKGWSTIYSVAPWI